MVSHKHMYTEAIQNRAIIVTEEEATGVGVGGTGGAEGETGKGEIYIKYSTDA